LESSLWCSRLVPVEAVAVEFATGLAREPPEVSPEQLA